MSCSQPTNLPHWYSFVTGCYIDEIFLIYFPIETSTSRQTTVVLKIKHANHVLETYKKRIDKLVLAYGFDENRAMHTHKHRKYGAKHFLKSFRGL